MRSDTCRGASDARHEPETLPGCTARWPLHDAEPANGLQSNCPESPAHREPQASADNKQDAWFCLTFDYYAEASASLMDGSLAGDSEATHKHGENDWICSWSATDIQNPGCDSRTTEKWLLHEHMHYSPKDDHKCHWIEYSAAASNFADSYDYGPITLNACYTINYFDQGTCIAAIEDCDE